VKLLLDHNLSHKLIARLADCQNVTLIEEFVNDPDRVVLELFD
jgi:hypothetical protein